MTAAASGKPVDARTSGWIPSSRIHLALGLAVALAALGVAGALWSPVTLVLLVPALGAGWAAFVMLQIQRQLSPNGGGWQRRIHEAVAARLELPPGSRDSVLDIGCGDASLLISLIERWPAIEPTGVDFWGADWSYAQAACEARVSSLGLRAWFHRMDAAHLAFPDETFDVVVSVMCFHEVKAPTTASLPGPLAAVGEALRVLKPGGKFVLIDRFGSRADYGDPAGLEAILQETAELRREPLVSTLGIPWPLRTNRAMGPTEMLSGRKRPTP